MDLNCSLSLSMAMATARLPKIEKKVESLQTTATQIRLQFAQFPDILAPQLQPLQAQLGNFGVVGSPPEELSQQNSCAQHIMSAGTSTALSTAAKSAAFLEQSSCPAPESTIPPSLPTQLARRAASNSIVFFRVSRTSRCGGCCDCVCHSTHRYRTPSFLRNFMGALFLGYSGPPILSAKCNRSACQNRPSRSLEIVYCFPWWFLERALHIAAGVTFSGSPVLNMELRRIVVWGGKDSMLRFALTGNAFGVKSLLTKGEASLSDVDPNQGRTALHYAVLRNKIEVCEVLLQAGADPHLQDDSCTSASQKAWEQILCRRGTDTELQGLEKLFPGNEALETWEFSYIHKVVLRILPVNLELELQKHQYLDQVDMVDSTCRTPLHWAATRGDEEAVRCLLKFGARVNAQDSLKGTPLGFAASSGSARILERLILAGADLTAKDNKGSQAIHHASRHQHAVEPVKILLRAGASVSSKNNLGHSPLSGAAITNRHEIGAYLLDQGACMHVRSIHGDTPLFETIFHNSHEFLQMLLDKGANHADVNKNGATILHAAALEADIRTLEILRAVRLSESQCSVRDKNGKTALEISQQRVAAPDGFQEAFKKLMMACKQSNDKTKGE